MTRVLVVQWSAEGPADRLERLREAGLRVARFIPDRAHLRAIGDDPPGAVVIDLDRMPSQGRDLGIALRSRKATRRVPLVFVGGDRGIHERVKAVLPDAVCTTWGRAAAAVKRAVARPPADPVVPSSVFAGYAGTPLPRKLGIKPGTIVGLLGAPPGFRRTLGPLPQGAVVRDDPRGPCDLLIWFPRSRADLGRRVGSIGRRSGSGGLWVAWAKRASGVPSDLTQNEVRGTGLAAGLVDYKICAIDGTWSALRFTRRGPRKGGNKPSSVRGAGRRPRRTDT